MFIVAIFILGLIVMLLWNALIPVLFHGPEVGYWQAVGLLVLTRVLVGIRGRRVFRNAWWHWRKYGPPWRWYKHGWNSREAADHFCFGVRGNEWWREWQTMTPEERQQAKEDWRRKKEEWKASWRKE